MASTFSGNNVLVSILNEEFVERDAGAVYLFEGATGRLIRTFENPTPGISDIFGSSFTTVGNNIAFAAALDSTAAVNRGAVYLFDGNGSLIASIVSLHPVPFGSFGSALAAFGKT